jgi:hypothetical protein
MALTHFTPWDANWGMGCDRLQSDCVPPALPPPLNDEGPADPNCQEGSRIICESQGLEESLPIIGTPLLLYYDSERQQGYRAATTLEIPLSGATLPRGLLGIEVEIKVAGRRFFQRVAAMAHQRISFVWDGKIAMGGQCKGVSLPVCASGMCIGWYP